MWKEWRSDVQAREERRGTLRVRAMHAEASEGNRQAATTHAPRGSTHAPRGWMATVIVLITMAAWGMAGVAGTGAALMAMAGIGMWQRTRGGKGEPRQKRVQFDDAQWVLGDKTERKAEIKRRKRMGPRQFYSRKLTAWAVLASSVAWQAGGSCAWKASRPQS